MRSVGNSWLTVWGSGLGLRKGKVRWALLISDGDVNSWYVLVSRGRRKSKMMRAKNPDGIFLGLFNLAILSLLVRNLQSASSACSWRRGQMRPNTSSILKAYSKTILKYLRTGFSLEDTKLLRRMASCPPYRDGHLTAPSCQPRRECRETASSFLSTQQFSPSTQQFHSAQGKLLRMKYDSPAFEPLNRTSYLFSFQYSRSIWYKSTCRSFGIRFGIGRRRHRF